MEKLDNVKILKYSTNNWLQDDKEKIEALKDILYNNSKDYSYNCNTANITIEHYNIKL